MLWAISLFGILFFAGLNTLLKHNVVLRVVRGRQASISEKDSTFRAPEYEEVVISQRSLFILTSFVLWVSSSVSLLFRFCFSH